MSVTLNLPEELTAVLQRNAEEAGQTIDAYVADALRRQVAAQELHERQQLDDIAWAVEIARQRRA